MNEVPPKDNLRQIDVASILSEILGLSEGGLGIVVTQFLPVENRYLASKQRLQSL